MNTIMIGTGARDGLSMNRNDLFVSSQIEVS